MLSTGEVKMLLRSLPRCEAHCLSRAEWEGVQVLKVKLKAMLGLDEDEELS